MKVLQTGISDLLIVEPTVHRDTRGFFFESYNYRDYAAQGITARFVQDNHSKSVQGTLRGLHYQLSPGQAKLVRVIVGTVFDVAVDIRQGSPTYGQWEAILLSAENQRQLYIPTGFAHGFAVLSTVAEVLYKVDSYYAPEQLARGIAWDDPDLAIDWPVTDPILSERDRAHPPLAEADNDFRYPAG